MADYDFYDYEKYWETREFEDKCERIALNKFFKLINNKEKIIDIGGGFGRLATSYANLYKECVIAEPSQNLINIGKRRLASFKNITFKKALLPFLPFESNFFDTVLIVRVMHHFPCPEEVIPELNRILKNKGFLILEFANKIHFLSCLKEFIKGNWRFLKSVDPVDRRSPESIKEGKIPFMGHHPKKIIQELKKNNFRVVGVLSVSNLRNQKLKKVLPIGILLFLENLLQGPLAKVYFGPSIFILAQKEN